MYEKEHIVCFLLGSGATAARGGEVEGTYDSTSADFYHKGI